MKPVSLVSPPKRTKPAETQSKASTTANAQKTGAVEPKKQPASSVTSSKSADAVQATHASIPNPKKSLLETTPSSISNRPEIPEVISEAQARSIRAQLAAANAKNKEHALTKYKRQSPALSNSSLESGQLRDRGTLKTPSHSSDHHQSSLDRRSHSSRRDQNQGVHAGWDVSSRDLSQDNRSDSWSYSRSKSRDSAGQNSKPQSSTHSAAKSAKVPTSELATKGGTKHHIDGTDERSPKRRQVSPRVTNAIMFSDVSSSGSESSDDFQSIYSGVQAHGISYAKTESNPRDGSKMTIEIKGSSGGSRASPTGNGSAVDIASRLGPSLSDYSSGSSNIPMRLGHYSADSDMGTDSYRLPRYSDGRHTPNSLDSESEWDGKGGENLIASQRSALRDCSGHVIDTERLDILFGPFVFVGLQSFPHLYNMYFGCQPLRPGIRRHILQRSLTSLAQFKYMDPNVRSPDGTYEKADFIARTGKAFLQAQRRIKKRLFSGAVPAPLVFCCLVQLICCQQNSLNSNMVDNMFRHVTQKRLHDLLVITKRGVNTYSSSQLWDMAKDWLFDLTKHITRSRNAVGSLGLADQLHTRYVDQCCKNSSDISNPDPTGKIAQKLLESEADAELFLGLRSSDLNQLYRYLVFLMSKNVSRVDSIYLKEVSSSFINVK
ncbi:hypothetical protein IWW36_004645 [Coemansia brasiliensis]|uniref:Uncharacterized protein n=1 Tax=Coemansia brasiliensis TaxID=2650707 RepID=A0A9W8IAC6_9FUNG|nr:hypothetical protein IWW36_004645 [Coemansia brasiliensis]